MSVQSQPRSRPQMQKRSIATVIEEEEKQADVGGGPGLDQVDQVNDAATNNKRQRRGVGRGGGRKARTLILDGIAGTLSDTQREALLAVESGRNVFVTGGAGVGKSFWTQQVEEWIQKNDIPYKIMASTGAAAVNVGGQTIYSALGIGLGTEHVDALCRKVMTNTKVKQMMTQQHLVWIVDEVSMVNIDVFTKIDVIARRVRERLDIPFGGIQMILVGDFLQLPPVEKSERVRFIFDSPVWKEMFGDGSENSGGDSGSEGSSGGGVQIVLDTVFRQNNQEFIDILNEVRQGQASAKTVSFLRSRIIPPAKRVLPEGIRPVRLCTHRDDVNTINLRELAALNGEARVFKSTHRIKNMFKGSAKQVEVNESFLQRQIENFRTYCHAQPEIELRVGAQVMYIVNRLRDDADDNLFNGSTGVVVGFDETSQFPIIQFTHLAERQVISTHRWRYADKERGTAEYEQIPLCLAWALTIHKSQGMTIPYAELRIDSCFSPGQCYVALSRLTSPDGLFITSFDKQSIFAHPDALGHWSKLCKEKKYQKLNE